MSRNTVTLEGSFAPWLQPGERLIEAGAAVQRDAGEPIARFVLPSPIWLLLQYDRLFLVGVTDRRLLLLRVRRASDPTVLECTPVPREVLAANSVAIRAGHLRVPGTEGDKDLAFDPILLDGNPGRAIAIAEAVEVLAASANAATLATQWRLDAVPFSGLIRRNRIVLGAIPLSFVAVLVMSVVLGLLGRGSPIGGPCRIDEDCADNLCVQAVSGPGVCSARCSPERPCKAGMRCSVAHRACLPPGTAAFGMRCRADWECESGDCLSHPGRPAFCTARCDDGAGCAPGAACLEGTCVPGDATPGSR